MTTSKDSMRESMGVVARLATAARIVVTAPVLLGVVAMGQWVLAKVLSVPVVAGVSAATEGYAPGTRPEAYERIVASVAELIIAEPSIAATVVVTLVATAVVGWAVWSLLAGAALARYAPAWSGETPTREQVGGRWVATLPGVVTQSLWHLPLRGLALFAVATAIADLPDSLRIGVIGITLLVTIVALDLARAGVVTGHGQPFHPRTAARAFMVALRTPQLLLPAVGLAALGLACVGATMVFSIWAASQPGWVWAARGMSLVTLTLGLTRLSLIVGHPALAGLTPKASGDEDGEDADDADDHRDEAPGSDDEPENATKA